jgi:AcrR family transcriptional regulator
MPKVTEQHTDLRRQQIIDAAYRCFARKGFHQTTMREIYAEAGLSAGAIYHYFASKDDIIEASFIFDHQRSLPVFEFALNDPDPGAALDQLVSFFYQGLESAASLGANKVNIQGWAEALVNPRLLVPLQATLHDFWKLLAQLIRRGQEAGTIDPQVDPEAAGEVIVATYFGLYLQKAIHPELDTGRYKDAVLALLHGNFARNNGI